MSSDLGPLKDVYFICLALLLAFGILQTAGTALSTDKPVVSVVSCSMYPEIDRGDILMVQGVEFDSIEEGQIVVYQVPMEAEIEIDGETYSLGEEPVETPIGSAYVTHVEDQSARLRIGRSNIDVVEGGEYSSGDYSFRVNEVSGLAIPVVHRVTEKRDDSIATKGDANPEQLDFEKEIRPEQIHGQVFFQIPKVGAVKLIAMDLAGLEGSPLRIDEYQPCSAEQ